MNLVDDDMKELAAGKLIVKKSQFYAHLYDIDNEHNLQEILSLHRHRYKKANHHCYALNFTLQNQTEQQFSADGEVGRPGRILLQLLEHHALNHHVIVVSRIFGGIKLGVGGVQRAFKNAAESVINLNKQK